MKRANTFLIIGLLLIYADYIGATELYYIFPFWINGTQQMVDLKDVNEENIYFKFDYNNYITYVPNENRDIALFEFIPDPKSVKIILSETPTDDLKIEEVKKLKWDETNDAAKEGIYKVENKNQKFPTILFRVSKTEGEFLMANNLSPLDEESIQIDDVNDKEDNKFSFSKLVLSFLQEILSFIKKFFNLLLI